jgi:hypothetical protein
LAPLRPGYTFLVFCLGAGPILASTGIPLEPFFLDLFAYIQMMLIRLSGLALLFQKRLLNVYRAILLNFDSIHLLLLGKGLVTVLSRRLVR